MEINLEKVEEKIPTIVPEDGEEEIWKDSISHPFYEVSSFGRLRRKRDGYIMNPKLNMWGYRECSLKVAERTYRSATIHRLVAEVFCEGYSEEEGKTKVDHIDQCRYNNYYKNLRYVTTSENFYNTSKDRKGISHTKVPVALVDRKSNEIIQTYPNIREASKQTGLNENSIAAVIHGVRKPFKIGYFVLAKNLT